MSKQKYNKEIKELVIQRIKAMPIDIKLCFGGNKALSIKDMVKAIESNEEIGNEIIEMHLNYLRSIKNMVV